MKLNLCVLPGDGIGPEVTAEAVSVLQTFNEVAGFDIRFTYGEIGYSAIVSSGQPLPRVTLDACLEADAVLLGAVGDPKADHLPPAQRPEAGLLQLRQALGGFANLRPAKAYGPLAACSPFKAGVLANADVLIVRELLGGLYFGEPRGSEVLETGERSAHNTMRYTESEIERVARVAFRLARGRRGRVASVDKANVLETSALWRSVVNQVGDEFRDVKLDHLLVDACAMQLSLAPRRFDVILTENLFGDILSDQAASFSGSMGMLPSATIGGCVDLYEPVHGSAPDIAGKGKAHPLGAIASTAMLLRHTAQLPLQAQWIGDAVDRVLESGARTPDIYQDGDARVSTKEMGVAVRQELSN